MQHGFNIIPHPNRILELSSNLKMTKLKVFYLLFFVLEFIASVSGTMILRSDDTIKNIPL